MICKHTYSLANKTTRMCRQRFDLNWSVIPGHSQVKKDLMTVKYRVRRNGDFELMRNEHIKGLTHFQGR